MNYEKISKDTLSDEELYANFESIAVALVIMQLERLDSIIDNDAAAGFSEYSQIIDITWMRMLSTVEKLMEKNISEFSAFSLSTEKRLNAATSDEERQQIRDKIIEEIEEGS